MTDELYVVARSTLLDALEALHEQRDAVILVGAQAIYVHTGDADIAVPAYTTDGDLLIEPASQRRAEARRGNGASTVPPWVAARLMAS